MSRGREDISERLELKRDRGRMAVSAPCLDGMDSLGDRLTAKQANDVYRRDLRVEKAIAAMRADPARRWTITALARVVGLSRAPFARRFREATGMTPIRWLTALRLGLAKEFLRDDERSLAEIAGALGYSSEFAFSKAFKRVFGIAPGRFRRVGQSPNAPKTLQSLVRAAA